MDLDEELTAQILSRVPLSERLTQCALVCRSWASAAALATEHVRVKLRADTLPAFQSWMQLHAAQLLSLQLTASGSLWPSKELRVLQLPLQDFSQLQQLELDYFRLCLPCNEVSSRTSRTSRRAAQTALMPSLQQLKLVDVELANIRSLLQLTWAPQLTSLEVSGLMVKGLKYSSPCAEHKNKAAAVQQVAQAFESMLAQLPRLSVLEVPGLPVSKAAAQAMGRLQGLQQLGYAHLTHMPLLDLQLLPSSITQLSLDGNSVKHFDDSTTLPQQLPQQLTGLLRLELEWCRVPATVFGSITQLQALHLNSCRVLPLSLGGEFDHEGLPALLDALPKLTCLQDFELYRISPDEAIINLQRFSALTASSHLTRLVLGREQDQPLPEAAALQHMFPAGRPALQLRELSITPGGPGPFDEWCIDTAGLRAIARSCPALQRLDIAEAVEPDTDLSALLQLPQSCTSLEVGGDTFDDEAAAVVAQLTQLRDLTWRDADTFTDRGLQQLTALDLDSLFVEDCRSSFEPEDTYNEEGCHIAFAVPGIRFTRDPQEVSVMLLSVDGRQRATYAADQQRSD
jgi:hypothetical protein